jgi:hypothetical protein
VLENMDGDERRYLVVYATIHIRNRAATSATAGARASASADDVDTTDCPTTAAAAVIAVH